MIGKHIIILLILTCLNLITFAQQSIFKISPELSYHENIFGGLSFLIGKEYSQSDNKISAFRFGGEFSRTKNMNIWIPKIGYEISYKKMTSRLNLLGYTNQIGLQILPEIGLTWRGKLAIYYGYSLNILQDKKYFSEGHRIGLNYNFNAEDLLGGILMLFYGDNGREK